MGGTNRPAVGTDNQAAREAWLAATLGAIPAGESILDAGAGELQYKPLCAHLRYTAQDFAAYRGGGDGHGLQMNRWDTSGIDIVSDITAIPVAAATFDNILCVEVLEHLPDPIAALKEFARVLRPGGRLILTAPFSSLTHFAPYHFATGFNRYFYAHHLERLGFEQVDIQANGDYFAFLAQELRRVPQVAKRYGGARPGPLFRAARAVVLATLGRLSRAQGGSAELLCYGLHVVARRRIAAITQDGVRAIGAPEER